MDKNVKFYLNKNNEFIIENFQHAKSFSSFFPGIAGVWGVPIWAFYVNRGQAITSFGTKTKDSAIMEFQPANKAYYLTPLVGFRTFIKIREGNKIIFYDAFGSCLNGSAFDIENRMAITGYDLKISEINRTLGIGVDIEYFPIPNDNYGALARRVTIRNLSKKKRGLEVLDGMPRIIPYGANNMFLKKISRTVEAWMQVENLENKIPFLRLTVDPADRPEVVRIEEGNFYLAFDNKALLKPIVDPEAIFGNAGDFTYPSMFVEARKFSYPKGQLTKSKTPCSMSYADVSISPGKAYTISSLIGNMDSLHKLKEDSCRIANKDYLDRKQQENRELIESLESFAFTNSSSKSFNAYCGQNFLDNVMRGGLPLSVEHPSGATHINVFTRKHGDIERDYNRFLVEPAYFSQGNGNYRDVNQNRRCDIWFNPKLRQDSIINFFSLIQTDGYNPLVTKPDRFMFNQDYDSIKSFFNGRGLRKIRAFLKSGFTPGELFAFIEQNQIDLPAQKNEVLKAVLGNSKKYYEAEHGEGFWIDHWHYCLDLLESYLGVYPEDLEKILFGIKEFTFFDNAHVVRPRSLKYILHNKRVFQYHSVIEDHQKLMLIKKRSDAPNISRSRCGQGGIYKTTLAAKMLTVIANKFATLDACGVGIEMDSDKPNWYDSLNGLPGLIGSSTCETFELKRWITFLRESIKNLSLSGNARIVLPDEVSLLLRSLASCCKKPMSDYDFWDKTHTLKEAYHAHTMFGFKGHETGLTIREASSVLDTFLARINKGLSKAYDKKTKLYYSYFINEVTGYKAINKIEHIQHVRALKFKQKPLPLFLEGIVHSLRIEAKRANSEETYKSVKKSALFDKKLKMYKVCAPLRDMPEEIGRCRVFTPGWLENESVWLHMEYKYMLELLKRGLYKEFYQDFKNVLIPFQDPKRYGRSILENSSFIVSSAFPQAKLHGNGFVARLSGSTAEFIHMWLIMCAGKKPFYLDKEKRLCLKLEPILPSWLFTDKTEPGFEKNTFAFKFMNKALIVYHNPKRRDTFGPNAVKPARITIKPFNNQTIELNSAVIPAPISCDIRDGKIERIDIVLE